MRQTLWRGRKVGRASAVPLCSSGSGGSGCSPKGWLNISAYSSTCDSWLESLASNLSGAKWYKWSPGEPSDLVTRTDSLCRMIEAHLSADRANSCQGPDESLWLHSVSFSPQLKQSWKPSSFAFTCPESLLLRPVSAILGKLFSRLLLWVFPSPLLCTQCCQSMFRWSLEFPMAKKSLPLAMVTYRPLVPAPRRQKLVVLCEFQASLVCIVSSVRSGLHCETLSQK